MSEEIYAPAAPHWELEMSRVADCTIIRPLNQHDQLPSRALLLGCVKTKVDRAAAARDLYSSPLWRCRRDYADASGKPWFVLSALHGLVGPDQTLEPYDLALGDCPAVERRRWGEQVVVDLERRLGSLKEAVLEVHAGAPYRTALERPLTERDAVLVAPLSHLALGEQLSWYRARTQAGVSLPRRRSCTAEEVEAALTALDEEPTLLPAREWPGDLEMLDLAGLYSWWVDDEGAAALAQGLAAPVSPGRIYAGHTGATKWPSGSTGRATLRSRIGAQHLRGTVRGSTFRRTLAAALLSALELAVLAPGKLERDSELRLSAWMQAHLEVAVHPFAERDALVDLERCVLNVLDPPLNLEGMSSTPLRQALSRLRVAIAQGGSQDVAGLGRGPN